MRLGVSAKIFLAYAVLLVAFAASSILSVAYLYRGQQEMAADGRRREIQEAVEGARRALGEYAQAAGAGGLSSAPTGRVAEVNAIPSTHDYLEDGRSAVIRYLTTEAPDAALRGEFEGYRRDLEDRLRDVAALGGQQPRWDAAGKRRAGARLDQGTASALPNLIDNVRKLADKLTRGSRESAAHLERLQRRAVDAASMLGGVGLLAAVGAALFMRRTLLPLRVLRLHARQIAGGDYKRRIVVSSRDEIGDLAREFDAMRREVEEREHRLIRSERLATVGRMAAQITHEIRNPLASLGLYVELLGDELPLGDGEARRLAAAIGTEIDRLSEITETYLRFVRLPRPKLEREDLGAIVAAVVEFSRAELAMASIALEVKMTPGVPEVAADENQIRQALLNLVRNAKEAMPAGGRLSVALASGGPGLVSIAVTDTGPGIAPEHLGKIFDPFFSTKEKGTGLGLALVQQIVAEHGGRIEVQSPPNGGTTFAISLPVAVTDGVGASEPSVRAPAAGPEPSPLAEPAAAAASRAR